MEEIGTARAQITKVNTTVDGGARVTFEFGYDSTILIQKILNKFMLQDKEVFLTIIKDNGELDA